MPAVPVVTPFTSPVDGVMVATAVFPLVHVPPVVASLRLIREVVHNIDEPMIAAGSGFTTTPSNAAHPLLRV